MVQIAENNEVNMNHSISKNHEDPRWLAFQYVAGELSAKAAEAFEVSMLTDPELCEMVAEASLLCCAVYQSSVGDESGLPKVTVPVCSVQCGKSIQASHSRGMLAAMVSVCCCLGVAAAVSNLTIDSSGVRLVETTDSESDAELLVDAWVDGANRFSGNDIDEPEPFSSELDVPEWLLTAVAIASIDQDGATASGDEAIPDDMELF